MSRVNIVKRVKIDGLWKMLSIPRNAKGNYDWNAIVDGRYYVEWYVGGSAHGPPISSREPSAVWSPV